MKTGKPGEAVPTCKGPKARETGAEDQNHSCGCIKASLLSRCICTDLDVAKAAVVKLPVPRHRARQWNQSAVVFMHWLQHALLPSADLRAHLSSVCCHNRGGAHSTPSAQGTKDVFI